MSQRCDLPLTLLRKGCGLDSMEHPQVRVEVDATLSSTQVTPSRIQVTLRPGRPAHVSPHAFQSGVVLCVFVVNKG